MTEQHVLTNKSAEHSEPEFVYLSHLFLDKLSEASVKIPHGVAVMLVLASDIDPDGAIKVSQAKVAHQCNITRQKVRKAVSTLADSGFINKVVVGDGPDGTITCQVSPDLLRCDGPESECLKVYSPMNSKY